MVKSILLIGLGNFGNHIANKLNELGHEVMAVDSDEKRVNEALPYVTEAQIGDSTNEEFLKAPAAIAITYLPFIVSGITTSLAFPE